MPITISYDLSTGATPNQRNYIRSSLERFNWRRMGGSVFKYSGVRREDGTFDEDWLNDVIPALMFIRAFIVKNEIQLKFLTLDVASSTHIDYSDEELQLGNQPIPGMRLNLAEPSNNQSSEKAIRSFVDDTSQLAPKAS